MEAFNVFKKVPGHEKVPLANPVEANDNDQSKLESGPDPALVEANLKLRSIVNDLAAIEKPMDRVPVFQRMFKGPEVITDDPTIAPFFDRIAAVEDMYGREAVREVSILYGADRIKGTNA